MAFAPRLRRLARQLWSNGMAKLVLRALLIG
jgi:hypothetical protein